jgi:hypothetical protein
MTAPDSNYELKKKSQLGIEFPFICLRNLKFVEHKKSKFFV